MKAYPSIDRDIQFGLHIYAFDKIDGSNMRVEWNRKNGFYKFGSRNRLLGTDQPFLTETIDLFKQKLESDLQKIFKDQRYENVVTFFEFFGPNTFAGHHVEEQHDVLMFDIDIYKKGILPPVEYYKLFGHLKVARLLYVGNANHPFVDSIKNGTLQGMSGEGVVCKAKNLKANFPSTIMFKIKTDSWIQKLKSYCKDDEKLFTELL
jgi:hypothetical protein